jgi:hypothetical protein
MFTTAILKLNQHGDFIMKKKMEYKIVLTDEQLSKNVQSMIDELSDYNTDEHPNEFRKGFGTCVFLVMASLGKNQSR